MTRTQSTQIPQSIVGDMGVALTRFRCGQLGLAFRETPTLDYGIDAEIEIFQGAKATGRLLSVQIKCGRSYLDELDSGSFIYRFEEQHYQYWTQYSLPVIIVLVDHVSEVCYWAPVTRDSIEKTGKGYKIRVPRDQLLDENSRNLIVDLATPLVSTASFELFNEEDVSTGIARRVSHYVRLGASDQPWTRNTVRSLILQVTADARASRYHRNAESAVVHEGALADVVFVYVYQSENHRRLGAYIARALWVDPSLPVEFHPSGFSGDKDPSGLVIDWNDDFEELVALIDEHRLSKAEYLTTLDDRMYITESVVLKFHSMVHDDELDVEYSEFLADMAIVAQKWSYEALPPHQCERLGQRASELIGLLLNAKIYAERIIKENTRSSRYQFERYIDDAHTTLSELKYERKLVV